MAFVNQNIVNDSLGNRAFALRGLGGLGGPEPVRVFHYDRGGTRRGLRGLGDQDPLTGQEAVVLGPMTDPTGLPSVPFTPTYDPTTGFWNFAAGVDTAAQSTILAAQLTSAQQQNNALQAQIQAAGATTANWFSEASIIPKVPNWAILGVGALAMMAMAGGSGGARRKR